MEIFERELALPVALQGESIWKGGGLRDSKQISLVKIPNITSKITWGIPVEAKDKA